MSLALLSDCHLCVDKPIGRLDNDMLQVGLNKLHIVFEKSYSMGIRDIIQAGDFVDVKRSWELLSALTKFLEVWKKKGMRLYSVLGQHDSYFHDMSNEKTIMGVLISSGLITRLSANPVYSDGRMFRMYGASYGEEIPATNDMYRNILVCHRQILMQKIWRQQEGCEYAPKFLKDHNRYELILVGDAHQKFDFKLDNRVICNSGPLMRLEATEAMMNHVPGFYAYSGKRVKPLSWHDCGAKLGKEILSKEHIAIRKKQQQNFDDFIDKVKEIDQENQSLDFNKNLRMIMRQGQVNKDVRHKVSEYLAKGE